METAMHAEHHHHHHHDHDRQESQSLTRQAITATAHCLIGCGIGEVLGLVIATALDWGNGASIALAVLLAFGFGYAFTLVPLMKSGMTFATAAALAFAADTVSVATMEVADNVTMLVIPGAMDAGLTDPLFWASLVASLAVAFVAAVPVNRWLIERGLGHAVVHAHHQHH
ncbi:MAG: DUF4396 domain-containing protein [Nitrospirae bacterium]|nr:MAG: DUF4396 domain-containing protein [Nitrospirota bacterium]